MHSFTNAKGFKIIDTSAAEVKLIVGGRKRTAL